MESGKAKPPLFEMHMVTAADSPEFSSSDGPSARPTPPGCLASMPCGSPTGTTTAARETAVVENPPLPRYHALPHRDLFQIACRVYREPSDSAVGESLVFLVGLLSVPLSALYEVLREILVAPSVLKLGFRFKQDPIYLSSTFSSQGAVPVSIDLIASLYGRHERQSH